MSMQPHQSPPIDYEYTASSRFMHTAIEAASGCIERGDHPVGAVVTRLWWDESTAKTLEFPVASAGNQVHRLGDLTAHAEIKAISGASMELGRYGLRDCVLYSTHEPCPMCAGAVSNSKLRGVVYGTSVEDVQALVSTNPEFKWRSNAARMEEIILGRKEPGVSSQFIIGGVEQERCMELLATTSKLHGRKEPRVGIRKFLRDSGIGIEEVHQIISGNDYLTTRDRAEMADLSAE